MSLRRLTVLLALAGSIAACEATTPAKPSAVIAITVQPNPVVIRVACLASVPPPEFCLASLEPSPTITVAETNGVGGRLESIVLVVRNTATSTELTRLTLDSAWIRSQAGTDRLEPRGSMAFRPVVSGYPIRNGTAPALAFIITVRFVDDNGNIIDQNLQVGGA